jgi:anti-sigma factor RsiW
VRIDHDDVRVLLGAYVLGGLSESDRRTLEAHLPDCAACRDELARSAPLTGLLRRAPHGFDQRNTEPAGDPARAASLERLLEQTHRAGPAQRRKARLQRLMLVAAAVIVLAALGVGLVLRPGHHHRPGGSTVAFSAAAGYAVAGHATLVAKPWGTSVAIALADLPAQGRFTLRVSSAGGRTEPACTWATTPTATAAVTGGTSMHLADIDAITIVDQQGHVLATARPS